MVRIYINGEIGQVIIGEGAGRAGGHAEAASLRVWSPDLPLLGLVLWLGLIARRLLSAKDRCLRRLASWRHERQQRQVAAAIRELQELLELI